MFYTDNLMTYIDNILFKNYHIHIMDVQSISKAFYLINKLNKSLYFKYFNNYLFKQNFYFAEEI